jgi:energy-coupling factor transport system ATP-binding protein
MKDHPPIVRIEGLQTSYNGHPVLTGVSLDVHASEFVAVMGDNGSGKSTLLLSLLGLLKPDAGQIEVLGENSRRVSVSELARKVGFCFQNPDHQIFAESVWEEAILAPHNFGTLDGATRTRVTQLLARCGLEGRHADHPYKLSYGEKRRLNLVSILSYTPQIILLDEVLIGQDASNAAFLMDLLWELVEQGSTVIMVNHDPEITHRYATRLVFMNNGRAIVDAPTVEGFGQLATLNQEAYLPAGGGRE